MGADAEVVEPGDDRLARPGTLADAVALVRRATLLPEAEEHRARLLAYADAHGDALHRSSIEAHLTGSAVVVDDARRRSLLMLHRKLGRWFQPGGHADGDGNLLRVAWREATEETGVAGLRMVAPALDLDVHEVQPPGEPAHLHLDLRFLALAPAGADAAGNHESTALAWVDVAGLDLLDPPIDPSTRRLVQRGLALANELS